jgi:prepilin-type N-terminal cleavage/methylation domain-containing protein
MGKLKGFSLTEMLVSMAIMGIIAATAWVSLSRSAQMDQMNTALRVVAADLRAVQSRALSVENIKSCLNASGKQQVCEQTTAGCVGACLAIPPNAFGMNIRSNSSTYDLYAEVEPTTADYLKTGTAETFLTRDLVKSGAPNVIVSALSLASPSNVAFQRQNGSMVINGCNTLTGCVSPIALTITLLQTKLNITKTIVLNAYTGRISIQ